MSRFVQAGNAPFAHFKPVQQSQKKRAALRQSVAVDRRPIADTARAASAICLLEPGLQEIALP
jgi:hypothetical protein